MNIDITELAIIFITAFRDLITTLAFSFTINNIPIGVWALGIFIVTLTINYTFKNRTEEK